MYEGDIVIPEKAVYNNEEYTVVDVPTAVFKGVTTVTSVVFPSTIVKLNDGTFDGCTALTSVTFPFDYQDSGQVLPKCTGLTSITIPGTVVDFGADAFNGAVNLESMTFAESDEAIAIPASIFNGGGFDKFTTLNLNRPIDGSKYTAMAEKPFRNNKTLTTIVLGSKVAALPTSYFEGCVALTNLTLPAELASLGTNVFAGCSSLPEITLPQALPPFPRRPSKAAAVWPRYASKVR